jgi:uridine kinase
VTRIAVDESDAAGKTTLADQLGVLLQAGRVCIDEFLRPEDERYARGIDSAEGYYRDSFDLAAFRAAVLP